METDFGETAVEIDFDNFVADRELQCFLHADLVGLLEHEGFGYSYSKAAGILVGYSEDKYLFG